MFRHKAEAEAFRANLKIKAPGVFVSICVMKGRYAARVSGNVPPEIIDQILAKP